LAACIKTTEKAANALNASIERIFPDDCGVYKELAKDIPVKCNAKTDTSVGYDQETIMQGKFLSPLQSLSKSL
jgi:hypothetical protein